jgi:hypothetical protein
LGETTARYPWFGGFYLLLSFVLVPGLVFLLSLAGPWAFYPVVAAAGLLALAVGLLNIIQLYATSVLPPVLRTWDFLPLALRSLAPYDAVLSRLFFCCNGRSGGLREADVVTDLEAGGGHGDKKFAGAMYQPMLEMVDVERATLSSSRTPIIKNLAVVGAIPTMAAAAEEREPILVTTRR